MPLNEDFICKTMIFEIFRTRKILVSFTSHASWRDKEHSRFAACKLLIQEHKPWLCMCQRNCAILGRFHILGEFYEFSESWNFFGVRKIFKIMFFTGKLLIQVHKTRLYAWCKKCASLGRFHTLEEFHEFQGLPKFSESENLQNHVFYR